MPSIQVGSFNHLCAHFSLLNCGRMYELRAHSKSYSEYMMAHTPDRYNDIKSLGTEKLRSVYAKADLRIGSKIKTSSIELIKEFIRAKDLDPSRF